MRKTISLVVGLLMTLLILTRAENVNSQSPIPTCTPNYQSCDPSISTCCGGFTCSGGYCVLLAVTPSPMPSIAPSNTPSPTPSVCTRIYNQCTGFDGSDPCQNYSNNICRCQQHGGRWLNGYCYPPDCRCGHSGDDCPSGWTCQSTSDPLTCSQGTTSTDCRVGFNVCNLGTAGVPCTTSDSCDSECGSGNAYCNSMNVCYEPVTCGSLEEGAGTCMPASNCPDDRERGQIDCITDQICCAPPPDCIGNFTNSPGECYFMGCPSNTYFDGFNPPMDTGCGLLMACCTTRGSDWINRNALNPSCLRNGQAGINTSVGCIPVVSPTSFLTFILPWAIGVAGGTSFILMVVAAFIVMTSAGDPQKAKAGKELLGAAITGLLMIIFSVYLLDVIGIRILKISGM